MTSLKPIKGWKDLVANINTIIAAVNARSISVPSGGGLDIQETDNGTLISLAHVLPKGTTIAGAPSTGGGGGGGGGSSPPDLSALTARVAALEAILASSGWSAVDVMDTSCVRSTINVLTKP